jgi:hypothetical protein
VTRDSVAGAAVAVIASSKLRVAAAAAVAAAAPVAGCLSTLPSTLRSRRPMWSSEVCSCETEAAVSRLCDATLWQIQPAFIQPAFISLRRATS